MAATARRSTIPLALAASAAALAAVGVAAPAVHGATTDGAARARGLVIQVRLPNVPAEAGGYVETAAGEARSGGPWALASAPGAAAAGNSEAVVDASSDGAASTAQATSRIAALSLLDGLVTADGVAARAVADARDQHAQAELVTQVTGLRVAGTPIADGVNQIVEVPGVGELIVGEQVDALHDTLAARSYAIALHLRVRQDYDGVPAGTEIIVGYVDAGAAAPTPTVPTVGGTTDAPAATTTTTATTPAGDGAETAAASTTATPAAAIDGSGDPTAGATVPTTAGATAPPDGSPPGSAVAVDPGPTPAYVGTAAAERAERSPLVVSAGRDTNATEDPPPGGFTKTPPISGVDDAYLLSAAWAFPVFGGADFSDDFGGTRATVAGNFHQGIDLFAPSGTAIVAPHDGTVFRVGANPIGGNRLWLDDGHGDLLYFAHLSGYAKRLSALIGTTGTAQVRKGEVIGFVGNTGDARTTPPHLHLELHPNGRWAIPGYRYVRIWAARSGFLRPANAAVPGVAPARAATTKGQTTAKAARTPKATASTPATSEIGDSSGLSQAADPTS